MSRTLPRACSSIPARLVSKIGFNLYWYHDPGEFCNRRPAAFVNISRLLDRNKLARQSVAVGKGRARSLARKEKNCTMNWDRIEGNWKQLKGKAREKWGKLT